MKVGLIVPGGVDRSGRERVIPALLALIERLAGEHDVQIFALRQEDRPAMYRLLGATVHNIGLRPRGLRAVTAILREHRREPFDVLHGFWAMPGAIAGLAGRALGVPVLTHLIGADLVSLPDIDYGLLRTRRGRVLLRLATATASQLLVESAAMQQLARSLNIAAQRVALGVDLRRWPPVSPRARSRPARLLQVASLNRVKDQTTLLRAAAALNSRGVDFVLDLVGQDTLKGAMQAEAHALGISDQVRFHGFVAHAQCRSFFLEADLLVVTSRHEAAPVVALEAAVCGVPAVGSRVGFLADWQPHAASTVPPQNPLALADAIELLLQDEPTRISLATNAQQIALQHDADWTLAHLLRTYEELARASFNARVARPLRRS